MLIAQITDTHIKLPGKLAYKKVDTAAMLERCVQELLALKPQPDLVLLTGDLVDLGRPEEYEHLKSILAPIKQRIIAIPGNHDERAAMRDAFRSGGYLPVDGKFLQFALDEYPLRIVGLDTLIPGQGGGELCAERLAWLDRTLAEKPNAPTLVLMHHPPFVTGIGHMDKIGLEGRDGCGHHGTAQAGRTRPVRPPASHDPRPGRRPASADLPQPRTPGSARHRPRSAKLLPHGAARFHAALVERWKADHSHRRHRRL